MAKEVIFGIRIDVDGQTAETKIERIETAATKMARNLVQAGKDMGAALDAGGAAATKSASATDVAAESEAAATARIRDMVAASIQKNTAVAESARSLDAASVSTRRAVEENTALSQSLERVATQTARPVATGASGTSSDEANKYIGSLQRQYDLLGKNAAEVAQYEARMLGGTKATQSQAAALAANSSALQTQIAAEQRAGQAADNFIARLKEQTAVLGMNRTQLLSYQAAQLGVSTEAAPMIARLRESSEAAVKHGKDIDGASKATHEFGFQTAQSKKEVLVLAHELSQGQFSRFGGSIMVLAEQTGAAAFLFSAAGLSILAVVAAVAVLVTAVVKGTMEVRTLNHDLLVTGNYAGATSGEILNLSKSISEVTHNAGQATDILTALTASGRFTGDAFVLTGEAASYMAKLTGESAKTVVKEFERMDQGVERFAVEFDKKYHMIGTATLEHISMLEKSQQKQEAESVAAGAIAEVAKERLETMREHLSDGQKAWADLGSAALDAWDKMKKAGSIAVASAPVEAELAWRKDWKAGNMTGATLTGTWRDAFSGVTDNDKEIQKLEAKLKQINADAAVETQIAVINEKGNAALTAIEAETKKYEKGEKKAREFMRVKQQFLDLFAASPDSKYLEGVTVSADKKEVSGGAYDVLIKSIEQRYKAKGPGAGSDPAKSELDGQIKAAAAVTEVEKAKYDQLNRLADIYHAAGELSDRAYYDGKRANTVAIGTAEIEGYTQQLDALQSFHGKTAVARQENANKIATNEAAMASAAQRNADALQVMDEQERVRQAGVIAASDDASNKYLSGLAQETERLQTANAGREESKAAIEREAVARLDVAIAAQKQFIAEQALAGATPAEVEQAPKILKYLEDVRAAREKNAVALDQQESDKFMKKAADQSIQDWERVGASISDSLSTAFGNGGKALGAMFKAYSTGIAGQLRAQKELAAASKLSDKDPEKVRAVTSAQLSGAQAQLKSYGDMTGAAQGYFAEGSKGYAAMGAAAQVMHAAEVALSVVKGVNAVLTQGAGDPYSAFARMATMAAIVVGLGVAIGGIGGGADTTAKERQPLTGVGSVLGDSNTDVKNGALGAKSESIAHSLAIMEKNSDLGLAHTISMDTSLKQMVSGIGNLSSLLARSGIVSGDSSLVSGISTGTQVLGGTAGMAAGAVAGGVGGAAAGAYYGMAVGSVGGPIGMAIGAVVGAVLGTVVSKLFNTKTSITDQGITGKSATLGDVEAIGFTAQAYADINTTKKAFGFSYSNKNSTETADLSAEMNAQFSMIISGLGQTVRGAAVALGLDGADFNARLSGFVVDLGKISLKGLTGEEQQKALETAFSKLGDEMAHWGVAGLEQYQAVGEGYLETLARVANDYMQVSDVLAVLGKSVGVTGLAAVSLSEGLIIAAGGLDKLASGTGFFVENFLSESERMAPIVKSVQTAMSGLGAAGVTTNEQFKNLVLSQDLNTVAGQQMYAQLLAIAPVFKTAADYAAELAAATGDYAAATKTASEIASEGRDLRQQLNELTKTEIHLLEIQRAAISDVNKFLFDQVQAAKAVVTAKDALSQAYSTEAAAAQTAIDKSKSWVSTLNSLNGGLAMGSLSTLTPMQKYAEAQAQFERTLSAANAGDATAQSGLSAAEQAFLTASQVVNASDAKYTADYARVQAANNEAMKWAQQQVDVQQASLDALTAQVSGLTTINTSVLSVAQAIVNLQGALDGATALGVKFDGSHATGLVNVPFDGYAAQTHKGEAIIDAPAMSAMRRYFGGAPSQGGGNTDALVAEIKGLRDELKGLRADQDKQASGMIQATFQSNDQNAKTVVAGVDKSAKASAWASKNEAVYD